MTDKPELRVVPFRTAPPLTDVVGQLRQFADAIERGEYGETHSIVAVRYSPDRGAFDVFEWGETAGSPDELAGKPMRAATRWMNR